MTSSVSAHPKEQMADHLASLRSYAKRVLVLIAPLTLSEAQDKCWRMNRFLQLGADHKCTEKELVGLVYEGSLR